MGENISVGGWKFYIEDENGEMQEIGEIGTIELEKQEQVNFPLEAPPELTVSVKLPLKSRIKFKWEMFKMGRRFKKLARSAKKASKAVNELRKAIKRSGK